MPETTPQKSILVVDDEQPILDLVRQVLEHHGYAVMTTTTGKEGLALARRHRPDLVILDIMLQDIDGTEVRGLLREDPGTADIPVIYLTGLMAAGEATRRAGDDGDLMIAKPFDATELVGRIEQLT